jgi:transcriptional antiterminator NusG
MQVRALFEERYIHLCEHLINTFEIKLYFPKREYFERRQGKNEKVQKPVFSGYVFLEIKDCYSIDILFSQLRAVEGFLRFLHSNDNITQLTGRDLEIVLRFLQNKGITGISKVYFNENDRIVVKAGPLAGLEGAITKVDKRKRRARVRLNFCSEAFAVDLGFEIIEGRPDT